MTPEQIELARHALGLGNGQKTSYRNHFVAGPGHSDYENWEAMVADGLAKKFGPRVIFGGDYCFILTREGAKAALRDGDWLDAEDFPEEMS